MAAYLLAFEQLKAEESKIEKATYLNHNSHLPKQQVNGVNGDEDNTVACLNKATFTAEMQIRTYRYQSVCLVNWKMISTPDKTLPSKLA